jgi:Ser/Thr protein kinase RdoA (MazF antagonist)
MEDLFYIAEQFLPQGSIAGVTELGHGNINDTFLVTVDAGKDRHFILQRINTRVFPDPVLVMRNMRVVTRHIEMRRQHLPHADGRSFEVPLLLAAKDGRDYWRDARGAFWRALSFIRDCRSFDAIRDDGHASEVGRALGLFHNLLSDLPAGRLADTLEGFHITPRYLSRYDEVIAEGGASEKSPEVRYCMRFIEKRYARARVLEDAKNDGRLLLRPIHGDPKVDNIMIDAATGLAAGIVDLDTVKPGLIHYDIGDCLRSGCNQSGEETMEWERVRFDTDICRAVFRGYLSEARTFLTENDFSYIYDAVRLIPFELGLRFLTDFLEGDVYFKVKRPGHNLARALVQCRLTESIESQEADIRKIIGDLR